MTELKKIDTKYENIPYMKYKQANFIREIITKNNYQDILELGFYHGKSSLFIASILEERGLGSLTTMDLQSAQQRIPNIHSLLENENLQHRVNVVYCRRSYTFELMELIKAQDKPIYDFCYFDGGHTLDNTGFGFYLVNKLLRPGGTIVFDDLNWTINNSLKNYPEHKKNNLHINYSEQEKNQPAVKIVFEHLVKSENYKCFTNGELNYGIAIKLF